MIKDGVIVALMLGATAIGWGQDVSVKNDSRTEIRFEVARNFGAILIRAQVNGMPATLVVDTGSSNTILRPELLQVRPLALPRAPTPSKSSGLVGRGSWGKATIQIGAIIWTDQKVLVTSDFEDLSATLKQRVDGIVGEDLLREFRSVVIDFQHHELLLLH